MSLLDLIQSDTHLKRYSNRHGGEYRGACPQCGGDEKSDRFIVWPEDGKGHFWCRQCSVSGDDVSYLVKVRGLPMRDALQRAGRDLSPTDRQLKERRQALKEKILEQFFLWKHEKLRTLTGLHEEIDIAEMAHRSIVRRPDLWTDDEQAYWSTYLGDLYFALTLAVQDNETLSEPRDAWALWQEEAASCL